MHQDILVEERYISKLGTVGVYGWLGYFNKLALLYQVMYLL